MRNIIFFTVIFSCLMAAGSACRRNHYKVNTSSIEADVKIKRFEQALFSADPAGFDEELPLIREEYGSFLQLFAYVINAGSTDDPDFPSALLSFATDRLNYEVYEEVMRVFPDMAPYEKELEEAFRHYLYYFPDKAVPSVISCVTGFNSSIIAGDSVIGLGLDRYLGRNSPYYPRLEIYQYVAARMNPFNLVPDCMYGWGASEWDYESMGYPEKNLLSVMLHEGKLKYFEKCMLPGISDTLLFGFTASQMKFCENNERQMWQYLIEHDLLFSTDQFVIRKLTGTAPFTSYFTNESPGRAAVWTGFRIVESAMKKNRGISLGDLMDSRDIQGLLTMAGYDPD